MRHGETEWNALKKMQGGNVDTLLNNKGRQQAQIIEETVFQLPIKKILHSPLKRAQETAEIVNRRANHPMEIALGFKESNLGDWSGISHEEFQSYLKQGLSPPNGETLEEF